ncbi:glycosyltransferase family 2 protein [Flammeovirga kamogawensis]|uniref:Glycosyltransferase family 2 protein n=1 Tax=Flammeovirga kamogawensis TaxID=373891 RepID=A0ABX8H384_9BACT|nr:glycosyltransferase family 2 protein [Flammeovirga kamogawensis]MBB6460210.1 cellulose synthase/poly-beta-1,6-N-acetylglucosamine synthase-like glycosyltransferase [Flammeovirga kamogawensis]QWG10022.1 glycosyltransferase family 2 protein [Flammeovirga kamogawensis]TRX65530.1 glycosyltransferase family 2 protein [Flammeovirga kamogawensis]
MFYTLLIYIFWIFIFITVYSVVGYGIVLYTLVKLKEFFSTRTHYSSKEIPKITVLIPCFNEADILAQKIENTFDVNYPKDKITVIVVADGSTDNSEEIVKNYPEVIFFHKKRRAGKSAAINRAIEHVTTPITICTDANTLLNKEAFTELTERFNDQKIGCVCGEKRILKDAKDLTSASEGMYWKYESKLKEWDASLSSVMGGAGELIAFRTSLYPQIPENVILDDFYITMKILMGGHKVDYAPNAYALESGSFNIKEEMKRKVRIAAGGFQMIFLLLPLLNIIRYKHISFQYISHRVLRWLIVPFALPMLFIINALLCFKFGGIYTFVFSVQILLYSSAISVHFIRKYWTPYKVMMLPYYYAVMNYCAIMGFIRFIIGNQSSVWEKSIRK